MNLITKFSAAILSVAAIGLSQTIAARADYPERGIQIIVPFAAGGATDLIARTIATNLSARLGKPVTVENRAGGGTVVGTETVVRAAPDGYMLLFHSGTLAIDLSYKKNLSYDVRKNLTPITKAAQGPFAVLVYTDVPVKTLPELVAYAKERPGKLNLASSGLGTMGHLASAYLISRAGLEITHVPFRGAGPALQAIIGGQIEVFLDPPFTAAPGIEMGKVRPLAVTSAKRSSLLPNVPTIAESGYPGFDAGHWGGFFAPAGTPEPIINKLNSEIVAVLQLPQVQQVLRKQGLEIIGNSPAQFKKEIEDEIALWAKVIKDAKIEPQ